MLHVVGNELAAHCINIKHRKAKIELRDGVRKEIYNYKCKIQASDVMRFDNGYCKNCGCHASDHDNT